MSIPLDMSFSPEGLDGGSGEPRPRGRPRDPCKDEAILHAAMGLFLERGFSGVSMDAVAAAAGVSKPTVYARYPDKDALFRSALAGKCDQLMDADAFAPPTDGDVRQGLIRIGRRFLELVLSDDALALHRVMTAESARDPTISRLFFEVAVNGVKDRFRQWIDAQVAAGRLKPVEAEGAAWRYLGAVKGEAHMRASLNLPPIEPEAMERHLAACADDFLKANGV